MLTLGSLCCWSRVTYIRHQLMLTLGSLCCWSPISGTNSCSPWVRSAAGHLYQAPAHAHPGFALLLVPGHLYQAPAHAHPGFALLLVTYIRHQLMLTLGSLCCWSPISGTSSCSPWVRSAAGPGSPISGTSSCSPWVRSAA